MSECGIGVTLRGSQGGHGGVLSKRLSPKSGCIFLVLNIIRTSLSPVFHTGILELSRRVQQSIPWGKFDPKGKVWSRGEVWSGRGSFVLWGKFNQIGKVLPNEVFPILWGELIPWEDLILWKTRFERISVCTYAMNPFLIKRCCPSYVVWLSATVVAPLRTADGHTFFTTFFLEYFQLVPLGL